MAGFSYNILGLGTLARPNVRGIVGGGITAGGTNGGRIDSIEFFKFGSMGIQNSNFGDLADDGTGQNLSNDSAGVSSDTRGIFCTGRSMDNGRRNSMCFITIATEGNATDFGDITANDTAPGSSNQTIGLIASGFARFFADTMETIEKITIASTGDAVDYGDLTVGRFLNAACGSPTLSICAGGLTRSFSVLNTIDQKSFASSGDATDFGDLVDPVLLASAASSNTIGLFFGGSASFGGAGKDTIETLNIASTGNASDFGDLTSVHKFGCANSNGRIAVIAIGWTGNDRSTAVNTMDQCKFASSGNATDFGDLTVASGLHHHGQISEGHGGLASPQ